MPGLIAVFSVVVLWETYAYRFEKEFISTATKRLQTKRWHRHALVLTGLAVTLHLRRKDG